MTVQAQSSTKTRTIEALLRQPNFRIGYNSILYSLPFEYDKYQEKDRWAYERGRQLAIICRATYKQVLKFNENFDLLVELYIQARVSQSICGAHLMGERSAAEIIQKRRSHMLLSAKLAPSLESLL